MHRTACVAVQVCARGNSIATYKTLTGDCAFNCGTAPFESEGGFMYWWAQVNDIQQTRLYQNLPYLINNRDRHTAFAMTKHCVLADSARGGKRVPHGALHSDRNLKAFAHKVAEGVMSNKVRCGYGLENEPCVKIPTSIPLKESKHEKDWHIRRHDF